MSEIDVSSVLAQMRALQAQAAGTSDAQATAEPNQAGGADFAELLKQSISKVNELQQHSNELSHAFSSGESDVDLAEVMIALQKAGLSFRAMTEVRNQLVTAYQEIMRMPI